MSRPNAENGHNPENESGQVFDLSFVPRHLTRNDVWPEVDVVQDQVERHFLPSDLEYKKNSVVIKLGDIARHPDEVSEALKELDEPVEQAVVDIHGGHLPVPLKNFIETTEDPEFRQEMEQAHSIVDHDRRSEAEEKVLLRHVIDGLEKSDEFFRAA